jgi:hypothetical protein
MGRMVKRLSGLEIDEVSLVDRPANQHGTIEISKADGQEDDMPIFDAAGDEVFEDELQLGDLVYDEQGQEFQVLPVDDEGSPTEEYEYDPAELEQYAEVGKGIVASGPLAEGGSRLGLTARTHGERARRAYRAGLKATDAATSNVGSHFGRRKLAYGVGGGAAAGGLGVGYGTGRGTASKSLGDQVLEQLSKAYSDDDRDKVIAKALDRVEDVSKRNEALEDALASLIEERSVEQFHAVAKSYDLPGAEEDIAGLLHRASQALPESDVAMLDRFFAAAGEIQKSYFEEVGYTGGRESSVLDEIYSLAGEAMSKNTDLGMSSEQAVTAMFAANPDAYDAYEAETRLRD